MEVTSNLSTSCAFSLSATVSVNSNVEIFLYLIANSGNAVQNQMNGYESVLFIKSWQTLSNLLLYDENRTWRIGYQS